MRLTTMRQTVTVTAILALLAGGLLATEESKTDWTSGEYEGSREQVLELMGYYKAIQLTPEQEGIRQKALASMPAPCCKEFSAATCCCECNLSRSIWGLSKLLITEHEAGPEKVQAAVEAWIAALNPGGYEGRTCTTGSCNLPFKASGCGGMQEHHLIYGD
ncbi:MAG: hypothetical protein GY719_08580 [bacterium]|nr:hypothetical protein [bacterium]